MNKLNECLLLRDKYYDLRQEEIQLHFIDRLKERYGIEMTMEEYNNIPFKDFRGFYKKSWTRVIGILNFKGNRIWCLYNNEYSYFLTVYPPNVETDIYETIRMCFSKNVRELAYRIYYEIKHEIENEIKNFESDKEAAIYFFNNCKFPNILIMLFKNKPMKNITICQIIRRIIEFKDRRLILTLSKKENPLQ